MSKGAGDPGFAGPGGSGEETVATILHPLDGEARRLADYSCSAHHSCAGQLLWSLGCPAMITRQTIKDNFRRPLRWVLCGLLAACLLCLFALPFVGPVPIALGDHAFELQAGFTRHLEVGKVEFVNVSPNGKRVIEGTRYQLAFVLVWVAGGEKPLRRNTSQLRDTTLGVGRLSRPCAIGRTTVDQTVQGSGAGRIAQRQSQTSAKAPECKMRDFQLPAANSIKH